VTKKMADDNDAVVAAVSTIIVAAAEGGVTDASDRAGRETGCCAGRSKVLITALVTWTITQ